MCNLCGEHVQDYEYYLHFYITGINSALKEVAKLCPYKTYLDQSKQANDFPCEVCANDEMQEQRKSYVERVGIKYRNFLNIKTLEQTSIVTCAGNEILVCPYTDNDVQSTICLRDAVNKFEKKLNSGVRRNDEDYIELDFEYTLSLKDKTKFDLMFEHKKHMDLHDTLVVELTEAYTSPNNLKVMDTLLKPILRSLNKCQKSKQSKLTTKIGNFKMHGLLLLIPNTLQNQ